MKVRKKPTDVGAFESLSRDRIILLLIPEWHPAALQGHPAFDHFVAHMTQAGSMTIIELRSAWRWFSAGWDADKSEESGS